MGLLGALDPSRQLLAAQCSVLAKLNVLASPYQAMWVIAKSVGIEAALAAVHYVAPVGENEEYAERARRHVEASASRGRRKLVATEASQQTALQLTVRCRSAVCWGLLQAIAACCIAVVERSMLPL